MKIHIVQKGDTLWKIAKKYGVNFEELKKINSQLSNPDMIMPGMKIKVPTSGGTIKKEAPNTGVTPEASIKMGAKKEMPIAKEKQKPLPVKEAPIEIPKEAPKKEAPKVEKPKPVAPIEEKPKVEKPKPVAPIQELPKLEKQMPVSPIQEMPNFKKIKTPYTPQMPQPVIQELDIQNYYMQNMSNMSVPQIPPKPDHIFPGMMKDDTSPFIKEEESPLDMPTQQGGFQQPMYPYPPNFNPVSPALPGSGYHYPGGFQPQAAHDPYVQGAATMPMHQAPYPTLPHAQMPVQQGMMPTFESHDFDESSSFMPDLPSVQGTMDDQAPFMPQVQGAMEYPDVGAQMPHQMPAQTMPAYHIPIGPCPPFFTLVSPVMPGPGFGYCPPYGPVPYGYPPMPQVQGAADYQMPLMPQVQGAGDYQMPPMPQVQGAGDYQMPHQAPVQGVKGTSDDCGCGGPAPHMGVPHGPAYGPAPGTTPIYTPHQAQPFGFAEPPYMNFGYGSDQMGSGHYGFQRTEDESSEYEG